MTDAVHASFDTSSVHKADRLEYWEARCSADLVGLTCTTLETDGLKARFDRYAFGELSLFEIVGNQHMICRSAEMVRKHDKDSVFLTFVLSGQAFVNRRDRCDLLNAGDLVLYDTQTPYMHGFPGMAHQAVFDVPGDAFRNRFPDWDLRDALRIDGNSRKGAPIASAMRRTCEEVRRDAATARASQMGEDARIGRVWSLLEMTHDLVCGGSNVNAYHVGVMQRARALVRDRLADPELGTEEVAAGVGMSSRQLNRFLGLHGLTVKKLIDTERLTAARRAIQDAGPGGASMADIAYRFGFSRSSHFSKSFRRHFGRAPSSLGAGEARRH